MEEAAKQNAARAAAPAPEVKGGQAFPRAPQEGVTWWDLYRAEMPDEEWVELSTNQKGNSRRRFFPSKKLAQADDATSSRRASKCRQPAQSSSNKQRQSLLQFKIRHSINPHSQTSSRLGAG